MTPSFYSLFRRGKYYHSSLREGEEAQTEESKRERREVERFAVAAVGFCLQHDKAFRNHFWKNVCYQRGDPETADGASIVIEEDNWSDLKITNGRCVAVVEFKAGAPLEVKQNPIKDEFWNETGYGSEMLGQLKQTRSFRRLRYTILGYGKPLRLGNGKLMRPPKRFVRNLALAQVTSSKGIVCCQRRWNDLHDGFEPKGIVKDLFDCLGGLNIKELQLMKIKKIHTSRNKINAEAANALSVIEGVKKSFGLVGDYDSSVESDESWWLGSNIEAIKSAKAHARNKKRIKELTGKESWFGWLGFEADTESGPRRAVWLYCADQRRAETAKPFVKKLASCKLCEGDLIITDSTPDSADYDWFAAVLRQLGLKES